MSSAPAAASPPFAFAALRTPFGGAVTRTGISGDVRPEGLTLVGERGIGDGDRCTRRSRLSADRPRTGDRMPSVAAADAAAACALASVRWCADPFPPPAASSAAADGERDEEEALLRRSPAVALLSLSLEEKKSNGPL